MLTYLYAISFMASLSGLIGWFYTEGNRKLSRKMSAIFLVGFFVYLFALAFSNGTFNYKLLILFRDLVMLGLVSQFFNFFKNYKAVFFGLLFLLYGLVYYKYWEVLTTTFSETSPTTSTVEVDVNAELLVEVKNGQTIKALKSIISQYDLSVEPAFTEIANGELTDLDDYYVVNIPTKNEGKRSEILKTLANHTAVDWVENNEVIRIEPMPATAAPTSKRNYGINDPAISQLWGFEQMDMDKLYQFLLDSKPKVKKKALIAILDTGVDAEHEDIKANFKSIHSKHDKDGNSHGTHCAGIAAAVSNNQKGIASFAPNNGLVQVSSVQVLSSFGAGTQRGILKGIIEAVDNGAAVVSMSLGGRSSDSKQRAYQQAVDYANRKGAIVVVAAGNSNMNAKDYSPANTPGVITVSAVDNQLNKAHFSNVINDVEMGIAAPGVNIYSTIPNNKYAAYSGTSMATPYVAGLLGVMKAIRPELTTQQAYEILNRTGKATQNTDLTGKLIQPAKVAQEIFD